MAKKSEKAKGGTALAVQNLVEPVLTEMGLRIWDVRFEKDGPDWFLRILIDRDTPIDLETCEAATRAINPVIDAADPIDQSYYMEVGSPGLGRRLTKEAHYTALQGQKVLAHLIRADEKGRKDIVGNLKEKTATQIIIETQDGDEAVEASAVSYVKLCDDEDLF